MESLSLSRVSELCKILGMVAGLGFYLALTDSILRSILARGCHELRSLDLSASATQLTDYSLHLIGWLMIRCSYCTVIFVVRSVL